MLQLSGGEIFCFFLAFYDFKMNRLLFLNNVSILKSKNDFIRIDIYDSEGQIVRSPLGV